MRQPIRDHSTLRESSHHCLHHLSTFLPYLGWITVGSRRNKCVSDLLNLIPKERIKVRKILVYFPYNSIHLKKIWWFSSNFTNFSCKMSVTFKSSQHTMFRNLEKKKTKKNFSWKKKSKIIFFLATTIFFFSIISLYLQTYK